MSVDFDEINGKLEEMRSSGYLAFAILFDYPTNEPNSEILEQVFDDLLKRYEDPSRGHHNMKHVRECLSLLADESKTPGIIDEDYRVSALAFYFHDVIYVPERADNEAKSAEYASSQLARLGVDPVMIAKVQRLIMASKPSTWRALPDEKLFHDIDYSVLGSSRERYLEYMAGIQKEFSGEKMTFRYRVGRAIFLLKTLFSGDIFETKGFQVKYGKQASENIRFELLQLLKS